MRRATERAFQRQVDPRILDGVLALLFAACALVDALGSATSPLGDVAGTRNPAAPRWLSALLVLTAALSMTWRRRAPLTVAVIVAVALVTDAIVSHTASFFGGFLMLVVAGYTAAAYGSRRDAIAGTSVSIAGFAAITLSIPQLQTWHDWLLNAGCLVGAIGFGRVVRRLRSRTRALARHAEALESQRDAQARAAIVLERGRIARELHDVIAHSVSLMGVQAAAAEQVLALDPERAREPLQAIQGTARDAIDELRRLLGVLRDTDEQATLVPQPGLGTLETLVEQMRSAGLPVQLHVDGTPARLSPGVELSAYRVVQEALTNALKHAGRVETTVIVHHRPSTLEIEVVDHGTDAIPSSNGNGDGTGYGVIGMRERVALYNGTLDAGPTPNGGYAVHAVLPTSGGMAS